MQEPDPIKGIRSSRVGWLVALADDPAKRIMPPAHIDQAARFIGELGFDPLLIFDGFVLVLEGAVEEALF
jgi:hypothetical protein